MRSGEHRCFFSRLQSTGDSLAFRRGSFKVDMLGGKVNRFIDNLSELSSLPGALTLRVGETHISLPEIRVNLEDLVRYRLEAVAAPLEPRRVAQAGASRVVSRESPV